MFKGATPCLRAWSPLEGSFRRQKVWLTLLHVPLHTCSLATFGRIVESFGNLISIRWKSLEALSLGSILLLLEVLDPKCIPPCVWIEVDNLFYPISLAWIEASPPSVNLVASSLHSLSESSSSFSWSVASRKSGLAKWYHRQNPHDLFPGKRVYRPIFLDSQWSSDRWSSMRIPRDTLPSISGDDGDDTVRKSLRYNSCHLPSGPLASSTHRLDKEVVEDLHSLGPSVFFKDPLSLVRAEIRTSIADLIHEGRNSLDKGTPAALTSKTTNNVSPPSIASAAGGIFSYDTSLSAQGTLLSLPLPLGLPMHHPPDGSPNSVFTSILPNLDDSLGSSSEPSLSQCSSSTKSQELLASFQSTPPCRPSLGLSEEAFSIVQSVESSCPFHLVSRSILSLTFLPFPSFAILTPLCLLHLCLWKWNLLLFPSASSQLLGPCLPQPSFLIPLGRITTILFPYEFSPSSPLNLRPQPFPSHFLSFYTLPPSLPFNPCPYPVSNWAPPPCHLGTLLVFHPLLVPPWLTLLQCLPRFRCLFLAFGNLSSYLLFLYPLFPWTVLLLLL
ncbi:hypothetical protein AMTRI_Chr07g25940 [Amborella trichopoda]